MRSCADSDSANCSRSAKPRKRAKASSAGVGRQRVGLLVRHHLQAMLDAAQKIVSRRRVRRASAASIQPPAASARSVATRAAAAQRGVAAAGDELLGLHEELDLADAAAAELDIVALDRDLAVAAIGVDLLLHRVDVGDARRSRDICARRRATARASKRSPASRVAGTGARLDQRRALPVLAAAFVIIERRVGRDRDLGRRRIGAQPQIDAEDVAVARCAPAKA